LEKLKEITDRKKYSLSLSLPIVESLENLPALNPEFLRLTPTKTLADLRRFSGKMLQNNVEFATSSATGGAKEKAALISRQAQLVSEVIAYLGDISDCIPK